MAKKRLGEMLLEAGIIDEHKLQAALGHQRKWGGRLGQALMDLKLATEPQVVSALSKKFGYQVVPPNALEGGPMLESAVRLVPGEFASRHNLMPFAMDSSTIWVAMSDPANIAVVDEIRFRTGRRVQIALAGDREIAEAVRRHYFADQDAQAVQAIPLEVDVDATPSETVVDQFGGGSTAAFDDFFSRPPEAVPVSAPGPALVQASSSPSPPPASSPVAASAPPSARDLVKAADGASLPAIDLDDLLPEVAPATQARPAQTARGAPAKGSGPPIAPPFEAIELPLEEAEPILDRLSSGSPAPASTSNEHAVLDVLDRLVHGEPVAPEVVKPAQMMAALVRLLLQKKIISEEEFLAEFKKK